MMQVGVDLQKSEANVEDTAFFVAGGVTRLKLWEVSVSVRLLPSIISLAKTPSRKVTGSINFQFVRNSTRTPPCTLVKIDFENVK